MYNGNSTKFGGLPQFSLDNTSNNANLKPEQTTAQEGGLEVSVLNDRITFDGTYYIKITRDQIIPLTTAPATGFSSAVINAGPDQQPRLRGERHRAPAAAGERLHLEHDVQLPQEPEQSRLAVSRASRRSSLRRNGARRSRRVEGEPYGVLFGYALPA